MLITNVRAHHIRIPYDAGVASFRQGASAIAALDMILVEGTTDSGLTGWGDAFGYVSPRTTAVAGECATALRRGYTAIKLDETTAPAVFAARQAIGPGIPLMVDMNCPLNGEEAIAFAQACRPAALKWLEEPVWPPEDFATLADVRAKGGLDIAAGENACTVHQFRQMMQAGAVSYAQPSVTKVGGITEYLKVAALAEDIGVKLAPHSPYFGPGLLATLQLLSLRDDGSFVEEFYMKRPACLWCGRIDGDADGTIAVPDGPGLGYEPDNDVTEPYRVS